MSLTIKFGVALIFVGLLIAGGTEVARRAGMFQVGQVFQVKCELCERLVPDKEIVDYIEMPDGTKRYICSHCTIKPVSK